MPSASPALTISNFLDHRLWDALPAGTPVPLQQHWAYGETLTAIGADVRLACFGEEKTPQAFALVPKRSFYRTLNLSSLMRGPLWITPPTAETETDFLKKLKRAYSPWRWNFLALQPEYDDTAENRALLRRVRFRRIMTGYSTVRIDLTPDAATLRAGLNGKWRNQLKKAEGETLAISLGGRKPHQYGWLLEKEADQQASRRYSALPTGFVPLYADIANRYPSRTGQVGVLSVTCLKGREKIAGALFLLHGNSATYHLGWSGDQGRTLNAQNRVLWEGMLALKDRGIRHLDLGGINTAEGAGIARFKLGLGTPPVTLAGTFL